MERTTIQALWSEKPDDYPAEFLVDQDSVYRDRLYLRGNAIQRIMHIPNKHNLYIVRTTAGQRGYPGDTEVMIHAASRQPGVFWRIISAPLRWIVR